MSNEINRGTCKTCGGDIEVEPGIGIFFERVCFGCGWFDKTRYDTEAEALEAIDTQEAI